MSKPILHNIILSLSCTGNFQSLFHCIPVLAITIGAWQVLKADLTENIPLESGIQTSLSGRGVKGMIIRLIAAIDSSVNNCSNMLLFQVQYSDQ